MKETPQGVPEVVRTTREDMKEYNDHQMVLAVVLFAREKGFGSIDESGNEAMEYWISSGFSKTYERLFYSDYFHEGPLNGDVQNITVDDLVAFRELEERKTAA
jgi:hypothetical protein